MSRCTLFFKVNVFITLPPSNGRQVWIGDIRQQARCNNLTYIYTQSDDLTIRLRPRTIVSLVNARKQSVSFSPFFLHKPSSPVAFHDVFSISFYVFICNIRCLSHQEKFSMWMQSFAFCISRKSSVHDAAPACLSTLVSHIYIYIL